MKTLTFAVVHFLVAFSVGYMLTGSLVVGGAIALIEPALNTIAYHFHERAWARIRRTQLQRGHRRILSRTVWSSGRV